MPARKVHAAAHIKLLVLHDHGLVRDALRALLEKNRDFRIVAATTDSREAVREAQRCSPDVVVADLSIPRLSGVALTRSLAQSNPAIGVIIVSSHDSSSMIRQALLAGARGYLARDSSAGDLVRAVRAVASGRKYFGDLVTEKMSESMRCGRPPADGADLTSTEREIVRLIAEGKSNSEAAELLRLSPRTVETYRIRAMRKLDLGDLPSLVKFAIRHGLTTLES